MALVVVLHGYGLTGLWQDMYLGISDEARNHDVLVVVPEGRKDAQGNQFWAATDFCCNFSGRGDNDVDYILGIIEESMEYFRIDPGLIALVGHSNGGFMSYRLACEASDVVTHVVSLAGTSWADADDCGFPDPVSALQIHGTWDTSIRYDGRRTKRPDPTLPHDFVGCRSGHCEIEVEACADDDSCAQTWDCMNGCGWEAPGESCRRRCYEDASSDAQTLWMEEFVCVLNAGCYEPPSEASAGYAGALRIADRWAERNGCGVDPELLDPLDLSSLVEGDDTTPKVWKDCRQGTTAELWPIRHGSHVPALQPWTAEFIIRWILDHPRAPQDG
jgi:poly(3-hydroxybutyrate) depolymerase